MLRWLLLYLASAAWARNIVTRWRLSQKVARRFVAGETLDEAIYTTRSLNSNGLLVTLDYLGESITQAEETEKVISTYSALLEQVYEQKLEASISLKLTHLGLDISEELCQNNLRRILTTAKQYDIPVTIDMESSAYTDITLQIYRTMRDEYDFKNVGTVIQAYLFRSSDDMKILAEEGAHIRLCKGAYLEPPEIAFPKKSDVDANYVKLTDDFLERTPPAFLCLATHDENMIQAAIHTITQAATPNNQFEFQMLYGIRSARQIELTQAGYQTRIYVPFGEAWYAYLMRRLAERPANMWFFIRSLFSR